MAALGNLVRLAPLSLDTLPFHPYLQASLERERSKSESRLSRAETAAPLETAQVVNECERSSIPPAASSSFDINGRPNLRAFVKAVLDEAVTFVDDILPATFRPSSEKHSRPAVAKVQVLKHEISGHELSRIPWLECRIPRNKPPKIDQTGEAWCARRSRHINQQAEGTATFREFNFGLRESHSEHEGEYTPEIFDTYKVLAWTISDEPSEETPDFGDYTHVTMSIFEMCHKLLFPLSTRVFPVLVITAITGLIPPHDFIVVQVPVDIQTLPQAFYSNGRNLREGDDAVKRKKPVLGYAAHGIISLLPDVLITTRRVYTSIERCVLRGDHIDWIMATSSDAKGWLPMYVGLE
ncbi:MAG: hypothetical protein Q9179_001220 [Wetmoreana sp. 5 TL-2023]